MFHNIVVAVDGSANAEQALIHAIDLSEASHGLLTLFTAALEPPALAYWASAGLADVIDAAEAQAARIAWQARGRVPDHVPVTCVVANEPVRQALIRQIAIGRHDLVVVGSRRYGALSSVVRGSVSDYIIHHSPVPVLVVQAESSPRRSGARVDAAAAEALPPGHESTRRVERRFPQTACSWCMTPVVRLHGLHVVRGVLAWPEEGTSWVRSQFEVSEAIHVRRRARGENRAVVWQGSGHPRTEPIADRCPNPIRASRSDRHTCVGRPRGTSASWGQRGLPGRVVADTVSSARVERFDLVFASGPGAVMLLDDPGVTVRYEGPVPPKLRAQSDRV